MSSRLRSVIHYVHQLAAFFCAQIAPGASEQPPAEPALFISLFSFFVSLALKLLSQHMAAKQI